MIPKIIHICWFGPELPEILYKNVKSWAWNLWSSEYLLKLWTLDNISDYIETPVIKWLYDNKLWGFLSDYIRLRVLYDYGGIYLDTDVEVIDNFDRILDLNTYIGFERFDFSNQYYAIENKKISNAIMGTYPKNKLFYDMFKEMENLTIENYTSGNKSFILFSRLFTDYIRNNIPHKVVNSIEEAKNTEKLNILPLFNKPGFDSYKKDDKNIQDYNICNHSFTNLWCK